MFRNYGDENFFDLGILVDDEHSDTEFNILWCRPYPDEENKFQFGDLTVDISDTWIDRYAVEQYGEVKKDSDPVGYAIACVDYYGGEEFGGLVEVDHEYIEDILRNRLIASDNLDMPWVDEPVTWFLTDDDDLQYVNVVDKDERIYNLVEYDEHRGYVYQQEIHLNDYTDSWLEEEILPQYGFWEGLERLKTVYPDNTDQILAEMVFEVTGIDGADSKEYATNREEAEKLIRNFIWLRKTVVW